MKTYAELTLEVDRLTHAEKLLDHTKNCPTCFPIFAIGGQLGSACAAGQSLRLTWVESIEKLHLNKDDCNDNRCDVCG